MADLDFSGFKGKNPLMGGSGSVVAANQQVRFTPAPMKRDADAVDRHRDDLVRRAKNIKDFDEKMAAFLAELSLPAIKVLETNSMNQIILERDKIIRAHRKGGDAVYAAVEELMAAPSV